MSTPQIAGALSAPWPIVFRWLATLATVMLVTLDTRPARASDTTPPNITCGDDKSTESGDDWAFDIPTAEDEADGANVLIEVVSTVTNVLNPRCPGLFSVTRTWRATDTSGNASFCNQTVTVVDTQPPDFACGQDKHVECGAAWAFDIPTAVDKSDLNNVLIEVVSTVTNVAIPRCPRLFSVTRTWRATDTCGNASFCNQTVTIVDTEPPELTCGDDKFATTNIAWTFDIPTAKDNCDLNNVLIEVVSTVTNVVNPGGAALYSATRTWRATDTCGNASFCNQTVTVVTLMKDLALWLKADALAVGNGAPVTQWADASGNARDATQVDSSKQPVLAASAVNGLPAVCFDGSDDCLTFNLPVNGVPGMTIFLVAANAQDQTGGSSQAEQAALFWNETQYWGTVYVSPYQSTVNFRFGTTQEGNRTVYQRPATVGNGFTLTTALKNGATDSLYVNGTLVVSQSGKLPSIAGCQDTGNLGRGYNDDTYFAGCIAEVLVYTNALVYRELVEAYLDAKYGLTAPVLPQITQQPASKTVAEPLPATFNVGATGTLPLGYQWRTNGVPIPGATQNSYTLSPTLQARDNGLQFDVVVSNAAGMVTSAVATLTVNLPPSAPPSIQTPPADQTVIEPAGATFGVVANGTAPLSYQWRRGGVDIAGANGSIYAFSPTSAATDDGAQFDVVVTNLSGSVTSAVATLTVLSGVPTADLALWLKADAGVVTASPEVTQWSDQSGHNHHATQGTAASQPTLVPGVINGLPVVRFDGVNEFLTFPLPVNGLSGMTLFLVAANTQNQNGGTSQAEQAALFWNETTAWGTVYLSPFQTAVNARFGTTQTGNRLLYHRPASVGSAFTLSTAVKDGTTDRLYVNGQLAVSESGKLAQIAGCQATGNLGRGYNDNTYFAGDIAEVLVYARAVSAPEREQIEAYLNGKYGLNGTATPHITQQPADTIVVAPEPATFAVVANGVSPLSYQWRRGGVDIPGATAPGYVLSPTAVSDSGAGFDVVVSSVSGSVTSSVAQLTVLARPPETDLALWLRADLGPVLSGAALTQWTDQSGQGRDATPGSVAQRPMLEPDALNGFPVVRFDGVDDRMTFTLPVNGLTGLSLFLVAANSQNQNGGGSQAEHAALFWNETASWGTVYLSPFQTAVNARFGTLQVGNRIQYSRPASVGSAFTLSSAIKDGATDSLYVNRVLVVSQGGKLPAIAGCTDIGALGEGYNGNTWFAGGIAEVLVYTRALSPSEHQAVEQYLDAKYRLTPLALSTSPAPEPAVMTSRAPRLQVEQAEGTVTLTLTGQAGASYVLERSGDLREWTSAGTIELPSEGNGIWSGNLPMQDATGFFRVREK